MVNIGYSNDDMVEMKRCLDQNGMGFPVFIDEKRLTGICPYCYDVHSHGLVDEMIDDWERHNGRAPHCLVYNTHLVRKDYELINIGPITPDVKKIFDKFRKAAHFLDGGWERFNYFQMSDRDSAISFIQDPDPKISQVELRKIMNYLRRNNIVMFEEHNNKMRIK